MLSLRNAARHIETILSLQEIGAEQKEQTARDVTTAQQARVNLRIKSNSAIDDAAREQKTVENAAHTDVAAARTTHNQIGMLVVLGVEREVDVSEIEAAEHATALSAFCRASQRIETRRL
jgi:hypothetical protein